MELLDALDNRIDLILRRKEGDAEVISSFTLTKTRARNNTDTSGLKKGKRIEGISRHVGSFSSFNGLWWKCNAGEEIHGTRRLGAGETFKGVDGTAQLDSTTLERLNDVVLLLLIELIRGISRLGRINHAVHDNLTHGVGAESDGNHLVEHGMDLREEVVELDVATTMAALTKEALGDGVETGNFNALPDVVAHVVSNLTETDELCTIIVHVLLVHLISKEDEAALDAETDNFLHAFNAENLAGWVVGIDHNKTTAFDALGGSLLVAALKLGGREGPASLLVERIANLDTVVEAEKRGIKRVLWSGSHDTNLLLLTNEKVEHVTDTSRGTISAVDGIRIAGNTITSSDEISNILTDERMALAEHVGARLEASVEKTLCTSNGIGVEGLRSLLDELRVFHEGTDLSDEGQRLLLELLRVTNVAIGNIIKRKTRRNALLLCIFELFL